MCEWAAIPVSAYRSLMEPLVKVDHRSRSGRVCGNSSEKYPVAPTKWNFRLMAAMWMSHCGIKTVLVDRRDENARAGQADGLQCRSMEIFDSFGMSDQIWNEAYHMVEVW